MVDWQSDFTVFVSARTFAFVICAFFGLYMWEWVLSLRFDWEHLTGKRRFRWTFIPYLLTRYSLIPVFVLAFRIFHVFDGPIDCQAYNRAIFVFAHTCFICASLLLLLRVLAVAQNSLKIAIPMGIFYLFNVGCLIYGLTETDAVYVPTAFSCVAIQTHKSLLNISASLAFDAACTLVMLGLLMQMKARAGGHLWNFLVAQGIVYFIVTTIAYVPVEVFLVLDLNDPLNQIFEAIALLIMSVCATRMYRNLHEFADNQAGQAHSYPRRPPMHQVSMSQSRTGAPMRPGGIGHITIDVAVEHHQDKTVDSDVIRGNVFPLRKIDVTSATATRGDNHSDHSDYSRRYP